MTNTPKYANKTCHKCGAKRSQPLMVSKQIYVESGKSQTTITGATFFGAGLGDKAAQRAIARAGFNSGERTYTRKKTVWECKNCNSPVFTISPNTQVPDTKPVVNALISPVKKGEKTPWWVWAFWIFVIMTVLSLMSG